jgi:hypothetical protein
MLDSTCQANPITTLTGATCLAVAFMQPYQNEFAITGNADITTTRMSESLSGIVAPFASEEDIARFEKLADRWRRETLDLSSLTEIVAHPAYLEIINMGKVVTPLILTELKRNPGHWFVALAIINNVNPVPAADAGNLKKMTAAWLKWGRERLV